MPDYLSRNERKSTRRIAKQVVRSIVGTPELKYWDTSVVNTAAPITTGASGYLTSIAGGSAGNERLGLEIRARSLFVRGVFRNADGSTAPITGRFILGIDRETTGVTPTLAEVLQDPTLILSPLNLTTSNNRFKILTDKVFTLYPTNTAAGVASVPGSNKTMKFFHRMSHKVNYTGPLATDEGIGHLFYAAISSAAGASAMVYTIYNRVRFNDV